MHAVQKLLMKPLNLTTYISQIEKNHLYSSGRYYNKWVVFLWSNFSINRVTVYANRKIILLWFLISHFTMIDRYKETHLSKTTSDNIPFHILSGKNINKEIIIDRLNLKITLLKKYLFRVPFLNKTECVIVPKRISSVILFILHWKT